jgi:GTPase
MEYIDPEKDDGNIEYKLHMLAGGSKGVEEWATQMQYRLSEGEGEAIYMIGIEDRGKITGISSEEMKESVNNLSQAAEIIGANVKLLNETKVNETSQLMREYLIRIKVDKYMDVKCAIAGNVDGGKTTLLGTLACGIADDGKGKARGYIFNHHHEIVTGRTSSVAQHIVGFDKDGKCVNTNPRLLWSDIVKRSNKIITFFDLAGHEKYLKTTVRGLSFSRPDFACIVIGANMGITGMTKEHMGLCISLNIPFFIVITKIDICKNRQEVLDHTITTLRRILKHPTVRKAPFMVKDMGDAITASLNVHNEAIAHIFKVSNVTGEGIDFLKTFLNLTKPRPYTEKNIIKPDKDKVMLMIESRFNVRGIGVVVGGELESGTVKVGDSLWLGPDHIGKYILVRIRSIHCKKIPIDTAYAGCYVCLALKGIDETFPLRNGMVVVSDNNRIVANYMTVELRVLRHSTSIKVGYEPVCHIVGIRQVAKIIEIKDKECLRTGDTARVKLKLVFRPEYIKPGMKVVMCEGTTRCIGHIVETDFKRDKKNEV